MADIWLIFVWVLIVIVVSGVNLFIIYHKLGTSSKQKLARLIQADSELIDELLKVDISEFEQTESGKLLLSLLSQENPDLLDQVRTLQNKQQGYSESIAKNKFKVSIVHPKLLSKRLDSPFLVQIYSQEMRHKVLEKVKEIFDGTETIEHVVEGKFNVGQIVLKLFNPAITFSDDVAKNIDNEITTVTFIAKPNDDYQPEFHQVILSISDNNRVELQSIILSVRVTDFVFGHISRPLLSQITSFTLGAASLAIFAFMLLGAINTTLGLTTSVVTGTLASAIYLNFRSLYRSSKPKPIP